MTNKVRLTYCYGGTYHSNDRCHDNPNGNDLKPFSDPHCSIINAARMRRRANVYSVRLRITKADIKGLLALPFTIDQYDYKLDDIQHCFVDRAMYSLKVPFFSTSISPYHNWEYMVDERCYSIWTFKDADGLEMAHALLSNPVALQMLA